MGFTYCSNRVTQHQKGEHEPPAHAYGVKSHGHSLVCSIRTCMQHQTIRQFIHMCHPTCVQNHKHSYIGWDCAQAGGRGLAHPQVTITGSPELVNWLNANSVPSPPTLGSLLSEKFCLGTLNLLSWTLSTIYNGYSNFSLFNVLNYQNDMVICSQSSHSFCLLSEHQT